MDKMTYVFDIDGTICNNTYGEYEEAKPNKERIKKVNTLYEEGHTIFMLTARGMGRSNNSQVFAERLLYKFTKKQLDEWGVKYHRLFMGKPAGDFYIDDKALKDRDFFKENK